MLRDDVSITGSVAARLRNISGQYGFEPQEFVDYVIGVLNGTEANVSRTEELLPLAAKLEIAKTVVRSALSTFPNPLLLFSGSKESTLTLYLVRAISEELGKKVPPVLFVDHFTHYAATFDFVNKIAREWNLDLRIAKQENFGHKKYGEAIHVEDLPAEQKDQLKRIGFTGFEFPFSLDNIAASYLLSLLVIDDYVQKGKFDGIFVSDDSLILDRTARSFWSTSGKWKRIAPLLILNSKDVWSYTKENNIPAHPLYVKGDEKIFNRYEKPKHEKREEVEDVEFAGVVENLKRLGYA